MPWSNQSGGGGGGQGPWGGSGGGSGGGRGSGGGQPPDIEELLRKGQDRTRLQNEAEAYANSIVPEARGLAAKDIQEATAYREQQIQEARGEADRFTSVYKAYTVAPEVTRKRMYLETIGAVLGQARKIIIDQKGGGPGVVPYLPLPEIQKRQDSNASSN